ncbi:MAG: hypothetical protein QGF00_36020 [Planctomycetota bacterium]|jgi:hypothetical protein|nr:hypothetical protein [Planctomycetota bacterium]MDP7255058.1 hypothetical protein [Planctomycetota bacterium]
MPTKGQWHGSEFYFGLHYDLHAGRHDTSLGTHCTIEELTAALKHMSPDYVQTDCKGHPGMTSWFSKVPAATVRFSRPRAVRRKPLMRRIREAGKRSELHRRGSP